MAEMRECICKWCQRPFSVRARSYERRRAEGINIGTYCSKPCRATGTAMERERTGRRTFPQARTQTEEFRSAFREAWLDDSLSREEISARVGIEVSRCYRLAKEMGLPKRGSGPGRKWRRSPEWIERLKQLWSDPDVEMSAISAELGIAYSTVSHMAARMGLGRKAVNRKTVYPQERIEEATRRLLTGETCGDIFRSWGIKPSRFRADYLRRIAGVKYDPYKASREAWPEEKRALFAKMWNDSTVRIAHMAETFNRSVDGIRRAAIRWKLGPKATISYQERAALMNRVRHPRVRRERISVERIAMPAAERAALAFPYLALLNEAIVRGCGNIVTGFDLARLNELRAEEGEPPVRILRTHNPARGRSAILGRPA